MLKTEIVIVPPLLIIIKQIGSALPHYIHDPLTRFDKTNLQGKDPKKRAPFMREERDIYIYHRKFRKFCDILPPYVPKL
jgi:hypothetical protein